MQKLHKQKGAYHLSSNIFSGLNALKRGMDAAWLRNEVINNNIANADTPDFKRSSVEFETLYQNELDEQEGFQHRKTRSGHMEIGGEAEVSASVITDQSTTMRMDGNNVDIDKEMVDLAQNVIYYNTLQVKMDSEFSKLKMAIREGR